MISEKRRNLSASWAASCANQMLRKAVKRSTARNPPTPSTGKRIGASTAPPTLASELAVDPLPLAKAHGLRPSFRAYPRLAQARGGLGAPQPIHPTQCSSELLPALLEDGLDEAQERIEVDDVHGRLRPHLHHHQRGVDLRCRFEGRCGNGHDVPRDREDLHRDGG